MCLITLSGDLSKVLMLVSIPFLKLYKRFIAYCKTVYYNNLYQLSLLY